MFDGKLQKDILTALRGDRGLNFKENPKYLQQGICPECGRKSVYISIENPGRLACSHKDSCGYTETIKERYPDIFEELSKRYPATPSDPNATARAYMSEVRGFPLSKIGNWFEQGACPLGDGKFGPTVRFNLWDGFYWQRLINRSDIELYGDKNHIKKGTICKDNCWIPPGLKINKNDQIFIVEGIFHAIALHLVGRKAVAAISSNVLPRKLINKHKGKGVTWCLGYDNDEGGAGNNASLKYRAELRSMGEAIEIYQCPINTDWDDAYRAHRLNDKFISDCLFRARVNCAETLTEKAYWLFTRQQYSYKVIEFDNRFYSLNVEGFNDALSKAINDSEQTDIEGRDYAELHKKTFAEALETETGKKMFFDKLESNPISNCLPKFLFSQIDKANGEIAYNFSVSYPNNKQPVRNICLSGSSLDTPASFKKALLNQSPGARFKGTESQFERIKERWFDNGILVVNSVQFVGYDKETGIYIFPKFAFCNGRYLRPNKSGYVSNGKSQLKTTSKSIDIRTNKNFSGEWVNNYYDAFQHNGLITLAFFVGSLFAEQVRRELGFFPFLELTGQAGAGKTTILEFCWKCLGRFEYEGINPSTATVSARARVLGQTSNLPTVLIEGDSNDGKDAKQKRFNFEELKDLFNGRGIRATGAFNRGNDIVENPFKGSIVIAQNATVDASEAILTRIVHVHATTAHHTRDLKPVADWFRRVDIDQVSGLLYKALTNERLLLKSIIDHYKRFDEIFSNENSLSHARIIECHALVTACVHSLPIIFPELKNKYIEETTNQLKNRALDRQKRLNKDHELVEQFWEVYDLVNIQPIKPGEEKYGDLPGRHVETLNHSKNESYIAVNLYEVAAAAELHKFARLNTTELKRYLTNSQRRKFAGVKTISSQITGKSKHCWVFKKEQIKE